MNGTTQATANSMWRRIMIVVCGWNIKFAIGHNRDLHMDTHLVLLLLLPRSVGYCSKPLILCVCVLVDFVVFLAGFFALEVRTLKCHTQAHHTVRRKLLYFTYDRNWQ